MDGLTIEEIEAETAAARKERRESRLASEEMIRVVLAAKPKAKKPTKKRPAREDMDQAAFRVVREIIEKSNQNRLAPFCEYGG